METQVVEVVKPVEEEELRYVGKSFTKVDAAEKVTGKAVYGMDLSFAHMLFAKMKRSDVPHGEILSIDTSKAMKVPGVRAIITGTEIPNTLFGAGLNDTPILARDRVRYVGDPVAAVAAVTMEAATEAATLVSTPAGQGPWRRRSSTVRSTSRFPSSCPCPSSLVPGNFGCAFPASSMTRSTASTAVSGELPMALRPG